jgi:hypothetical protein
MDCGNCKYWKPWEMHADEGFGNCQLLGYADANDYIRVCDDSLPISTHKDFGCKKFEKVI